MNLILTILIIIVALSVEVFFSGSEIALVVADKMKLKTRADAGNYGARAAMWFVRHPAQFFSTVILGTNVSVVIASTVATFYLISVYGENAEGWALLLSPVVLIFGEVLPKSIFQHYAGKLVRKVSQPLMVSMYAMLPFVWVLSKFTNFLLGGVTHRVGREPMITREELRLLISSSESLDVHPSERKMVVKVLELAHLRVENVMVPLALIESLPITAKREKAMEVFDLKGYSKLPVFEHRAYNIVGIMDCLDCLCSDIDEIRSLVKPVIYVPKDMRLHKLYFFMKEKEEQVAIAVDEYGAAVGMVTLEDVLEEIVGDISDEHELGRQHYRTIGEGHYIVSGRIEIEEANEKMGLDIPKGDYETVAGYLVHEFGTIPAVGEAIQLGRWLYAIKKSTDRAVVEIEVRKM